MLLIFTIINSQYHCCKVYPYWVRTSCKIKNLQKVKIWNSRKDELWWYFLDLTLCIANNLHMYPNIETLNSFVWSLCDFRKWWCVSHNNCREHLTTGCLPCHVRTHARSCKVKKKLCLKIQEWNVRWQQLLLSSIVLVSCTCHISRRRCSNSVVIQYNNSLCCGCIHYMAVH